MKLKLTLLMLVMLLTVTACGTAITNNGNNGILSESTTVIDKDREGNVITLPQIIDRIISIGPSNTEILTALGFGDKIIAADTYSENVAGINPDIPLFSMLEPDGEQIINLNPDIIFITGMSKGGGSDPFRVVEEAGVCIIYIPTSLSIDSIKEDIRYMSNVMAVPSKGEEIIGTMEAEIDAVKKIGETQTDKKTVYFEISAAPYMYSFGRDVFLDEMIELIGAKNALGDQECWISVSDEAILEANPDVILTSVNYIENVTDEIKSRPGWDKITAVANDDVYYIDSDASNRPSQNIVKALKEMAKAVYPDAYN